MSENRRQIIRSQQESTPNRRKTDELKKIRMTLVNTSHSVEKIQLELPTKAGQFETSQTLGRLRREITQLAAATVGKQEFQFGLQSKLDRRDLGRIAAMVTNGSSGDMQTAVHMSRVHWYLV